MEDQEILGIKEREIQEIETKKRSLKRYKKNRACIDRLSEKLDLLDKRIKSVRSPNYSGMPRGGTPVDIADLISEKTELENRIDKMKKKGVDIRREILEEIDSLDDVRYCDILEMFFIEGKSFDEIADEKGYNTKSVIRLYSRAIRELVCNSKVTYE